MKQSIGARVGRIISGGFNQLIDAFENAAPEAVMEEAIREIDGTKDDVRAELGKVIANKHMASRRLADDNARHEDLSSKIELAINEGREDLAEAAVSLQLDLEAQIPVLESNVAECIEKEKELEGFISALEAKKREMRSDLAAYRKSREGAAQSSESTGQQGSANADIQSRAENAESAFDRVLSRQTGVDGARSDLTNASQMAELEDLARKNRIAERLAAAKAKIKKD